MIENSEIKTILQEQRLEYQRFVGTVAQQFQQSLKFIAETIGDLQKTACQSKGNGCKKH